MKKLEIHLNRMMLINNSFLKLKITKISCNYYKKQKNTLDNSNQEDQMEFKKFIIEQK